MRQTLTASEAAAILGIHRNVLLRKLGPRRRVRGELLGGMIPARKVNGRWQIRLADLRKYQAGGRKPGRPRKARD